MDVSAESDSSTGHGQSKTVASAPVTPLPNHGGKVGASSVQTLNGANIINSLNSGISSTLNGTSVSSNCISSASDSSAVTAVTVVNNGPQTPYMNPPNAVTSSQVASLGSGSTVTPAMQSVQIEGSGTTLNGNNNSGPVNAASQLSTTAPCMGLQTRLNNGQPPAPVSVSAGPQIIKAEAPKTIIQSAPQTLSTDVTNTDNFTPGIIINPPSQSALRTSTAVTTAANQVGIRAIASQVLAPRLTQSSPNQPNVQNIQLPPGVVLVRSETGQLLMIHQQTLAQMQAQGAAGPRPATPTGSPQVQITSAQVRGSPTIIRQGSPAPTSAPVTATLQRPPVLQSPIGAALPSATPRAVAPSTGTTVTLATETMENVKKCKNFLSTLIKLASSGKQSSETAANVRDLVKDLLEGKLEAEDFTSRLYRELNSSPQPYLVPFLKRSLPALRQLTPDAAAFIQQSQQPATAVVLGSPAPRPAAPATRPHPQPVISKQVLPAQQQGAMARPTLATAPAVTPRGHQAPNRVVLGPPQLQVKQLQGVPVVRPGMLPGSKLVPGAASLAAAAQKNRLKEAGAGVFRDDDDINDVASMAGVNLSEESARILATNSEVVGAVTRSCKEEAFLYTSTLQRRILELGKKFGVMDLGPEVVTFVSHATQQRLQNLLEKVSEVAQQRNFNFKEDSRYEQTSDVRAQLKFFEQLDQAEKQRKEEQEREILMKAAKSRARQEDPEQLRLKQKAKEMQQQEQAQMRQREANLTALAAIGPRKKRKLGAAASSAGVEGGGSSPSVSGSPRSAASRQLPRQRITRVNLRDLLFCLENERETSLSHLLYRGFLK